MRRLLAPVVACVLLLPACGGSRDEGGALPAALAADLAQRSEAVARLFAAGEPCKAWRGASRLADAVERGARTGAIPASLETQIDPVVASLVAAGGCPRETPSDVSTDAVATEDEDGNGRDKEKKNKNKDKGQDPHDNGHGNDDDKDEQ